METLIINQEKFNTNPEFYENLILNFYHKNGDKFTKDELKIPNQIKNGVFYSVVLNKNQIVSLARLSAIEIGGNIRKTMYMLRQIDTLEKFRNKGCASNVIQTASGYLKNAGCKKILSIAATSNIPSIQMHLKNGFEISKPTKSFRKSRYFWDGVYFEKKLNEK